MDINKELLSWTFFYISCIIFMINRFEKINKVIINKESGRILWIIN